MPRTKSANKTSKPYTVCKGSPYPIGATVQKGGTNFSLFSKNCNGVELLLFDKKNLSFPSQIIQLDPQKNKTFYYWHCFLENVGAGQVYAYRVSGEHNLEKGYRFDSEKVLLDPYARSVISNGYVRQAAIDPGDNCAQAMKSVVIDCDDYDWEDDQPLNYPFAKTIIYELHPSGFTKDPSSGVAPKYRGTYRGLIEKIPYLQSLGITAIELLPVQQFDPFDAPPGRINYWGYSPIAFFAPHNAYASSNDPVEQVKEFKDMVKALHKAGIEVILDVVFNHTAEGNEKGPTLSFKGIENAAYYMLPDEHKGYFCDFTGTGNTLNANHSVVRRMILDCLSMWVQEMHVDGFRFDLASVLARDERGNILENPPLLWQIESDPRLASVKIIAEAWDIKGYQLGDFVGDKWAEWNGKFRDDIREFIKSSPGKIRVLADRIMASPNVFGNILRDPNRSINFITCHDGFTLNDLISYNHKHNEANNEDNRDGHNDNHSWNHGVEGPTDDPEIENLRIRQIKNALTILMISQGTPMLSMGDEIRRTQMGNNNAYCQDNEISWFPWHQVDKEKDLLSFVKKLIEFNIDTSFFQEDLYWSSPDGIHIRWHGTTLDQPDWSHDSRSLAFTLYHPDHNNHLHVMLNAYWEDLTFELPPLPGRSSWHRIIDTNLSAPDDCTPLSRAAKVEGTTYRVNSRSVVVLQE